jgi:hypothetical protein
MIGQLLVLAAAAAQPLPQFTFKEHRAGAQYDIKALRDAGCKETAQGFACDIETEVAGTRAFVDYFVANGKLARLNVSGFEIAIPYVVSALRERYGQPCGEGVETVSNRLGGQFQSKTITWCFATGNLVFHQRWGSIETYSLRYMDRLNVPASTARPDF